MNTVFRRAVRKSSSIQPAAVDFQAGAEGMVIRLIEPEFAIEYRHAGVFPIEGMSLPLTALADFDGKSPDNVTLEGTDSEKVIVRWRDAGVPQVKEYELPDRKRQPIFPDIPRKFVSIPPILLTALDDAFKSAAEDSTRYSLNRIQLRGRSGQVVATDGKQLLIQSGFTFPWSEDVLIPRLAVFNARDLGDDGPVRIAKTDKHVVLDVGPWTIYLWIDTTGRFPDVDLVIPKITDGTTRLRLDPEDVRFLNGVLPYLPGRDEENRPITVDLNGQVCLRAKSAAQNQVTEVILSRSSFTGREARIHVCRDYLARALHLNCSEICIVDPNKPFVGRGENRSFVIMPLASKEAVPPTADATRIESANGAVVPTSPNLERTKTIMPSSSTNGHAKPTYNGSTVPAANGIAEQSTNGKIGFHDLLAEADALKEHLRQGFSMANHLVSALKRHRQQSKLVASTIASLKQLQQIDA